MQNIWDVYTFIRQLTDRGGKGYLSPAQISGWLQAAQMAIFNGLRASGKLDNETQSALAPLATTYDFTASSAGHFTKPAGYVQSLRIVNTYGKEHTPVLFNELRDALSSAVEPIEDNPRYGESGNYFALYPQQITSGTMTYYRLPLDPVIGATADSNGYPVYDSGTSTELELPKAYWFPVIMEVLKYAGVNLNSAELLALSQQTGGNA